MGVENKEISYRVLVDNITYGPDSLPYTNATYGIDNGLLTLDSSDGLMLKLSNSTAKINISKGGNLGGGYTFGFSIINDLLSKVINDEGVFLNESTCDLQINTVGEYGISDTGNEYPVGTTNYPTLASMTGTRFVSSSETSDKLETYDWDGENAVKIGNDYPLSVSGRTAMCRNTDDTIFILGWTADVLYKMSFDGVDWLVVGNGLPLNNTGVNITRLGVDTVAVYRFSAGTLKVYSFDGLNWSIVGNYLNSAIGWAGLCSLSDSRVVLSTQPDSKIKIYDWDGLNWSQVGNEYSALNGFNNLTAIDSNSFFIASDTSGKMQLLTFDGLNVSELTSPYDITSNFPASCLLESDVIMTNYNNGFLKPYKASNETGYSTEWSGKIDSIKKVSETEVGFSCTDATKKSNVSIGSDEKGICLNRNFYCKLNLLDTELTEYPYDQLLGLENDNNIFYSPVYVTNRNIHGDELAYCITLRYVPVNSSWIIAFNSGEQLFLKVGAGDDTGSIYTVVGVGIDRLETGGYAYNVFTREDPSSLKTISGRAGSALNDCSLVKLIHYNRIETLSEKECEDVHGELSTYKQPLTVYNDEERFYLSSPFSYTDYFDAGLDDQMVNISGLSTETEIVTKNNIPITSNITELIAKGNPLIIGFDANIYLDLSQSDLKKMASDTVDGGYYLDFESIDIPNLFTGSPTVTSVLSSKVSVLGYYKNNIMDGKANNTSNVKYSILEETEVTGSTTALATGSDIEISFDFSKGQPLELSTFEDYDMFRKFTILVRVSVILDSNYPILESTATFNDVKMIKNSETKLSQYSIGSNGENVQSGNEFESVTDTIKYLQTEYLSVDVADIDTTSYSDAEAKFELFPSATTRNPAHQIVASTEGNKVLKDILYAHHLGMYINKSGKWVIKNWLPDSITFYNNILPVKLFTDKNCIAISDIKRDDLNNVISEFELTYDFNEALNKYNDGRVVRVSGTDKATVDNQTDFTGVHVTNLKIAHEAWELLRAGYQRVKRLARESKETKWIKHGTTKTWEGSEGEGEALNFIRNQAGHVNRPHEYMTITVPINDENLDLDLLSFISVRDPKITDNVERLGWIVERKIDTTNHVLIFKLLLDISATDPFLVEIGVLQDDPDEVGNEYIDDPTEVNEIIDGDGK